MKCKKKVPKILNELLNSKLFTKIKSNFNFYILRLIKTDFILTVPIFENVETMPNDLRWLKFDLNFVLKPGILDPINLKFITKPRTLGPTNSCALKEIKTSELFEILPKNIVKKMIFYINYLPRT